MIIYSRDVTFDESAILNQHEIRQGDSNHRNAPQPMEFETPTLKEHDKDRIATEDDIGIGDVKKTDDKE